MMGKRSKQAVENRKNEIRRARNWMLVFFSLLATAITLLTLSGVKERLFPDWVVENWSRLMAVVWLITLMLLLIWPLRRIGALKGSSLWAGGSAGIEGGYDGGGDLGGCGSDAGGGDGSCD